MAEPIHDRPTDTSIFLRQQAVMSDAMRRDMLRANTAVVMVLVAVLVMALIAMFAGWRAAKNLRRAETAESKGRERLRLAYTEEARAIRVAADAGGRMAALIAISNAVAIQPSPELRTEATACLALSDLVQEGAMVPAPKDLARLLMDPQMKYFATGDMVGNVQIFSLVDGSQAFEFPAASLGVRTHQPIIDLTFSPDSSMIATRFDNGAVAVWNLQTCRAIFTNSVEATNTMIARLPTGLVFSADSKQLIFGDVAEQGQISIYDLTTGQKISSAINVIGKTYRMRPDLKQVAVITDNRVEVFDYPAGTKQGALAHSAHVEMVEWSPDGLRLAVSGFDGDVFLWERDTDVQRHFAGHSERSIRLNFNFDGTRLFSSSRDGRTRLWDVTLGRLIAVGEGFGCTFTADGQRIGYWRPVAGFGTWRLMPSKVFALHECDKAEGSLLSIDLSPSGRWCVVTQGKGFRLWDLMNGDRETYVPGTFYNVRMAMDEKSLFVCKTNGLETWPLTMDGSGALELSQAQAKKIPLPDDLGARAVALSQDDRWAAVELMDRRMVRIDLTGHAPVVELKGRWRGLNYKGPGSVTGAGRFVISPDGNWVVTGFDFESYGPRVWNANTGELAAELPAGSSLASFTQDGRWLGLSGVSRYSIWSVGDWHLQKEFIRDEATLVHGALAFMPDAGTLAISQTRQLVQLRDWQTDEKIGDLIPPAAQSINTIRVSLNGAMLVMATGNDMVEVWRLSPLREALAAMGLDWNTSSPGTAAAIATLRPAGSPEMIFLASLGGFALVAILVLLTLRRHRTAIERFVVAEASAAQRNRELDLAKVELMHSQKMQALGTLATGIAHDFNNLLSVVRMSNKLIARQAPDDPEIQEHVTGIEQAVLQGKSVVSSVLGYARPGKDTGEFADVSAVVNEVVALLSREFLSGIELTLELDRNAPRARVARGPLEQVLLNLLVNASEAMQGEGHLKIVLHACAALPPGAYILRPSPAGEYVELNVVDTGPGIAPEIRDRLFEPFFTTKQKAAKAGTGLGLSLVYSIAQQTGIGLSLESEPGKGARFTLFIPAGGTAVRQMHSAKINDPA
ncbi:MAG TPA: ATP-binding protein [Verrucomicrobiae bacterium]|nr:ATP-binding protein [Verrucomicrobiae bacterium]